MNPVSVDLKDILVADGVGVFAATTGWGIYLDQEPTSQESTQTAITIYNVGGDPDDTLNGIEVSDFVSQIRARGTETGYASAYAKMEEIVSSLNQLKDHITGSTRYAVIYRSSTIRFLKRDDANLPIWVCDFAGLRTTE